MLNQSFLDSIRTHLNEELARLEGELRDLATKEDGSSYEATYPESGSNSDDDNAMEITTYSDEVSLVDRLQAELKDTKKALKAIDDGTYGTCKYCGKEIDQKRLEARPTSSSCISCKKQLTQEL